MHEYRVQAIKARIELQQEIRNLRYLHKHLGYNKKQGKLNYLVQELEWSYFVWN